MQNQKQITLIASILIVIGLLAWGGYALYKSKSAEDQPVKPITGLDNLPDNTVALDTDTAPNTIPENPPKPIVAKPADAWQVFQQYLVYLKNHDVAGVNSVLSEQALSYGKPCPMRQGTAGADCNKFMDAAYQSGIVLNKADFVNRWEDGKQIILSTDVVLQKIDEANKKTYEKFYLFFTKENGAPQFLASYHVSTYFTYENEAVMAQRTKEAFASFEDSDRDGLLDYYENCKAVGASPYNTKCSNTSSAIRDSLGDGWWDGVRIYFGTN